MLVRIGAGKLPINLDDIFDLYPTIIRVPYTEFKKLNDVIPDWLNFDLMNARIDKENAAEPNPAKWKEHIEAFTIPVEETPDHFVYFIYYDDRVKNKERIRWSICHELGHIFAGHFADFDLRTSNFINITNSQYGVLELEAHWYASELLAPSPVMFILRNKLFTEHISLLCDISFDAAQKKKYAIERKKYEGFIENRQMMLNFSRFIFETGYWDSVYRVLRKRFELYPRFISLTYNGCRVCQSCGAFVRHSSYLCCQHCGERLATDSQFLMDRRRGIEQPVPDGKVYPSFEETKHWRAVYCPRCKNYKFSKDDEFCPVCQTPLYNRCLEHGPNKISLECRRAPCCGGPTDYSQLYDELKGYQIRPPARYKGYHWYEDWGYIRFLLLVKIDRSVGMPLYSILSDSAVYTDYDNYVLVFVGDNAQCQEVYNNIDVIKGFIETYGQSHVEELYLYRHIWATREIYWIIPKNREMSN